MDLLLHSNMRAAHLREQQQRKQGPCAMSPAAVERHKERCCSTALHRRLQLLPYLSQLGGSEQHQVECLRHARRKPQVRLTLQERRELHEHPSSAQVGAELPHDQGPPPLQEPGPSGAPKPAEQLLQDLCKVRRLVRDGCEHGDGFKDDTVIGSTEGV